MYYIKGIRFGLHFLSRLFTNMERKRNMDFVMGARKLLENYSKSSAEEEEIILKSSNLVVIMAAMLCALICLLGLFSMVRCALRCRGRTRPFVLRSTHRIFFPVVDRGLDKAALQTLPVVEYCKEEVCGGADCAICLTEFADGEKVRPLPNCGHCFHVSCIDTWFVAHSSCPTCRGVMSSVATESEGNADSSAASVSTTLRGIACPLQYWNRNMLDPTIDRYLP